MKYKFEAMTSEDIADAMNRALDDLDAAVQTEEGSGMMVDLKPEVERTREDLIRLQHERIWGDNGSLMHVYKPDGTERT